MYFVTVLEAGSLKFNKAVLPLVLLRKNPSFASSSSKCLSWHSGLVAISQAYDDTCLCHHIAFSYVTVLIPFVSLSLIRYLWWHLEFTHIIQGNLKILISLHMKIPFLQISEHLQIPDSRVWCLCMAITQVLQTV